MDLYWKMVSALNIVPMWRLLARGTTQILQQLTYALQDVLHVSCTTNRSIVNLLYLDIQ